MIELLAVEYFLLSEILRYVFGYPQDLHGHTPTQTNAAARSYSRHLHGPLPNVLVNSAQLDNGLPSSTADSRVPTYSASRSAQVSRREGSTQGCSTGADGISNKANCVVMLVLVLVTGVWLTAVNCSERISNYSNQVE